mmetsp:Transcript_4955/g.7460  ORF Transcript_4955/g.7460 Transcript_4955/m.7460 type:complete len:136 (-) Transcript_4955:1041-1448(-)
MEGPSKTEIYGFIVWATSFLVGFILLAWAIIPDETLKGLGISYYPSKYWAVALPCYFIVLVISVMTIYQGLNMMAAKPPSSYFTLEDQFTRRLPEGGKDSLSLPDISDMPISVVNKILYSEKLRTLTRHSSLVQD